MVCRLSITMNSYKKKIEASIRLEPGVITLYGVTEKDNPEHVFLFETYADSNQYRSHLATPHFQKYKQGTLQMVKQLDLIQMEPIIYHRKPELSNARQEDLYIRLIKIELDSNAVGNFEKLGNSVMLPGIKQESGVLVMYGVAEKNHPTRVSILDVRRKVRECACVELPLERGAASQQRKSLLREAVGESFDECNRPGAQHFAR